MGPPPYCPTWMMTMEAGPEDRKGQETGWEGTRLTTVHVSGIIYQRAELCGRLGVINTPKWD